MIINILGCQNQCSSVLQPLAVPPKWPASSSWAHSCMARCGSIIIWCVPSLFAFCARTWALYPEHLCRLTRPLLLTLLLLSCLLHSTLTRDTALTRPLWLSGAPLLSVGEAQGPTHRLPALPYLTSSPSPSFCGFVLLPLQQLRCPVVSTGVPQMSGLLDGGLRLWLPLWPCSIRNSVNYSIHALFHLIWL
jgi:hypothetical protein